MTLTRMKNAVARQSHVLENRIESIFFFFIVDDFSILGLHAVKVKKICKNLYRVRIARAQSDRASSFVRGRRRP